MHATHCALTNDGCSALLEYDVDKYTFIAFLFQVHTDIG